MFNASDQPTILPHVLGVARVNGIALHAQEEVLTEHELRQRACSELLRQEALRDGLLGADDPPAKMGVFSEAATQAIERWLDQNLALPEPDEDACRRHYAANAGQYRQGERVRMRHILFAVTPGVDVKLLRSRAEVCLLDVRCHDGSGSDAFADAARSFSNCPSGAQGGDLGWTGSNEFAPEMAREIFGRAEIGVLPRLVHSRFGLHVVEILEREPGVELPFEAVRGAVQHALRQQAWVTALRQCLQLLAAKADIQGVQLDVASSPLVQ